MSFNSVNLVSPKFVKALSLVSLEKKMRGLILNNGKQYNFFFFQQIGNEFIAWYNEDIILNYSGLNKPDEKE